MEYNLNEIKNEITLNCKKVFDGSTSPSYSDYDSNFNFDNGINLFFRVILFKTNVHKLDGLPKTIFPALQDALISKRGDLNSLKIIIEELEPFLKKLIYINSNFAQDYSNNPSKTLMPLFKELSLNQELNNNTAYFSEQNLDSFRNKPEFQYYLCNSYLVRNQIHNSPNWDLVEVATNLRDLLITYLYSTFKLFSNLVQRVANVPLPNQPTTETAINLFNDPKLKPLYDFMSYNNTTYEIRTEIIKSYILHFLSNQSQKVKIDQIQQSCNSQFKTKTDKNFYDRILRDLNKIGKIAVSGLNDDEFQIEGIELQRIKEVKEFFIFQKEMFLYEITEALKKYDLQDQVTEIVEKLIYSSKRIIQSISNK